MRYSVILSSEEAKLLMSILSQPLEILKDDDCFRVYLKAGDVDIYFEPEEVATPDKLHEYADVTRPKVLAANSYPPAEEQLSLRERELGMITEISLLNVFVAFSDPEKVASMKIGEAEIPEGTGYGFLYLDPKQLRVDALSERAKEIEEALAEHAIVEADLGIKIVTDREREILIYTNGINYMLWANLSGQMPDDLKEIGEFYQMLPLASRINEM
jgi:hypothetical protein